MFIITFKDDHLDFEVQAKVKDEDATLTQVFAYFVEVCRGAGYYPGSFHSLIKELSNEELDETYTIFNWASDYLVDHLELD